MDPVKHQLQMSASNHETVSLHLKHGLAALFLEKFGVKACAVSGLDLLTDQAKNVILSVGRARQAWGLLTSIPPPLCVVAMRRACTFFLHFFIPHLYIPITQVHTVEAESRG
jgi:hypothetical protein